MELIDYDFNKLTQQGSYMVDMSIELHSQMTL